MKRLFLSLTLFAVLSAGAQSPRFHDAMVKNLTALKTAKTAADYQDLSSAFERIGDAEKDQWLPYYWAAYCQVIRNYTLNDTKQTDAIEDKATALLDKAESLSPNMAEILVLRSMTLSSRIMVDMMSRGPQYGPASNEALAKAIQLDPNNPRPYFISGQAKLYTPANFGGGKDKARPLLEKSVALYETFKPASDISPNWGKDIATNLLTQTK